MNKSEFRKQAAIKRNSLFSRPEDKKKSDDLIFDHLIESCILKKYQQFLTYVSFRSEVDTKRIINTVLVQKSVLAVPKCGSDGKMDFYKINTLEELTSSHYGIPEPMEDPQMLVTEFDKTVCIVPGLTFDIKGKRMGYGGGFYDRFLSMHPEIITVGLCYNSLLSELVPSEPHDISVDYIITEKGLINING